MNTINARLKIPFVCLVIMYISQAVSIVPVSAQQKPFALLAVSWQPSFCEQRPKRPECRSQTATRYDASHFSLHGLWPQPRSNQYCKVNDRAVAIDKKGRWGRLPNLGLSGELYSKLAQVMPGTRSYLHRHEWLKHGTCHENGSAKGYYEDSLKLMSELNTSRVQKLFAGNIGNYVSTKEIQLAFDTSFGAGAGLRIRVNCKNDDGRRLIEELTIGLSGDINPQANLGSLMLAARPTSSGCGGGIVDPAGLQ